MFKLAFTLRTKPRQIPHNCIRPTNTHLAETCDNVFVHMVKIVRWTDGRKVKIANFRRVYPRWKSEDQLNKDTCFDTTADYFEISVN